MAGIRRSRPGLLAAFVASAVVTALLVLPAPKSQAFYIQDHERITRDPLAPVGVDNAAMNQILVGPPPGARAVGSDAFFSDGFRRVGAEAAAILTDVRGGGDLWLFAWVAARLDVGGG